MHFIRTGKTSPGGGKRFVGRLDLPLCGEGEQELRNMREELSYPRAEVVFTSPLSRCVKTAEILYPDIYRLEADGLTDMDLGEFSGKSFEELRGGAAFSAWLGNSVENPPPGGETMLDFTQRIVRAASGIFFQMMDEKITNAAVITHGGVIMTLLAAIGQPKVPLQEWSCGNGQGYTLIFTPQMWMQSGSAEVFRRIPALKDDAGI
jgi:alpha-ribazole phosphatase